MFIKKKDRIDKKKLKAKRLFSGYVKWYKQVKSAWQETLPQPEAYKKD